MKIKRRKKWTQVGAVCSDGVAFKSVFWGDFVGDIVSMA